MSLSIHLEIGSQIQGKAGTGIFVRQNGATVEITREEWDAKFPGREPVVMNSDEETTNEVYYGNITHNLNKMAEEAGIYKHMWRPEELGITKASELVGPLRNGLYRLHTDPARFKLLNPPNGWGSYERLVEFVTAYLEACKQYPDATIRVYR
jgi:hypothetical protein